MSRRASSSSQPSEPTLFALFQSIVAGDGAQVSRWLAKSPGLAQAALEIGASREQASDYFFQSIAHYAYGGDTALHLAAAAHAIGIAEQLLAKGAHVQARNRRGAEPLHYAVDGIPGSPSWNPEAQSAVIALLIRAGADPSSLDKSGVAPLHRAVRTRCAAAVRVLLANGVDARAKNKSGSTPLHLAVKTTGRGDSGSAMALEQQREIIEALLAHGARSTDRSASGRSVKDCAKADWIRALLG